MKKILYPMMIALITVSCNGETEDANAATTAGAPEDKEMTEGEMNDDMNASTAELDEDGNPIDPAGEGFNSIMIEDYTEVKSKENLYSRYDNNNLEDTKVMVKDKEMMATTLKDPNTGEHVEFIWGDDKKSTYMVKSYYNVYNDNENKKLTQIVKSDCGVYTGMPLSELEEWNGAPIEFSGFGWKDGGGIFTEKGSKLAGCPIVVRLSYDENVAFEGRDGLMGEKRFKSNDKKVNGAPIFVGSMAIKM